MDDKDKVELTVGDVRRAAEKCGTAKEVLKEMFPQVFEDPAEDVTGKCLITPGDRDFSLSISYQGKVAMYLRHSSQRVEMEYGFYLKDGRIWRKK